MIVSSRSCPSIYCGQRICALTQDGEVAAIAEDSATPPAGNLLDDVKALEVGKCGVDRPERSKERTGVFLSEGKGREFKSRRAHHLSDAV